VLQINENILLLYFLGKLIRRAAGAVKRLTQKISKRFFNRKRLMVAESQTPQKLIMILYKIHNHDRNFDLKPAAGYKR
jgi:hypothetical protein